MDVAVLVYDYASENAFSQSVEVAFEILMEVILNL